MNINVHTGCIVLCPWPITFFCPYVTITKALFSEISGPAAGKENQYLHSLHESELFLACKQHAVSNCRSQSIFLSDFAI